MNAQKSRIVNRYFLRIGILIAVVAAIAFGLPALSKTYWVGSQEIDVVVIVRDASALSGIADARIEVLEGPDSLELRDPKIEEFEVKNDQRVITDDSGRAEFPYRFSAAGSSSFFHYSGSVETRAVWLRIQGEGYVTTYIPVDRQSLRTRNIDDETPIFVTVPVAKLQPKTEN